jgi:hypothetical protein
VSTDTGTQMAQGGGSGITLIVMSEAKLETLAEKAKSLLESVQRHQLELGRAGLTAMLREGDGCCNCVAC